MSGRRLDLFLKSQSPEVSLRPLSTLHFGLCYRESSLCKPISTGLQTFLMMRHVVRASGCLSCCLRMDQFMSTVMVFCAILRVFYMCWDFSLRTCSLGDKLLEHPVEELFGCCEQRTFLAHPYSGLLEMSLISSFI